jgi:hypothetical protein
LLRLRHPSAAAIKSVTVNGKLWNHFDRDRAVVELKGISGTVALEVSY